ncbi:MAG: VacJ family lipoprotein [Hyphomicrobiales bacterium]
MDLFMLSAQKPTASSALKNGFFLSVGLLLAGCSSVHQNNSALLIQPDVKTQVAASPLANPRANPTTPANSIDASYTTSSHSSYGQTTEASASDVAQTEDELVINDKHEGLNRFFFGFNRGLDLVIVRPISKVYGALVPGPIRLIARNGLRHLETPGDLINYTLQGNGSEAGTTLKRFVINSTLGLGGAFDVADHLGTSYNPTDFGLTLAEWGVGEGSYVVNPLLGPSTVRDTFGRIGDIALSPTTYIGIFTDFSYGGAIANGTNIVDQRQRNGELLDDVIFASPDPYVTLRSTYIQRRRSLASGNVIGAEGMEAPLPEIQSAGQ